MPQGSVGTVEVAIRTARTCGGKVLPVASGNLFVPAIIAVEGLSKTYAGGFQALKTVDLDDRAGRDLRAARPNGAGKTTLIGIVCGIVKPTAGTRHRRRPRHRSATTAPPAPTIGLVPQELAHRHVRDRVEHGHLQPRPVRQAAEPDA